MKLSFMVIDDSELDCFIARKLIVLHNLNMPVKTFFSPIDALTDITTNPKVIAGNNLTVILLDLIMPEMNGFQFIEAFENLPAKIQDSYFLVSLTSSMNKTDLNRLAHYKSVNLVLDKPLTIDKLNKVINITSKTV